LKKEHASSTTADKKSALLTCSNHHGIGSPLEIGCNRLANQCHPPGFSNLDAHIAGTRNHEKEEEEGKSAVAAKVGVLFAAKLSRGVVLFSHQAGQLHRLFPPKQSSNSQKQY
jgi:hypothetical protein